MTKLKLIKKLTSDWFDSHKFVNQVYWGDFIRWYADKQIQHSSVVITPIRVTEVTRSKRAIQLQITYADRVYSDFRNLDEVHSDADRTLADFILSASNDKELRKFLTGLTSGNIEYFTNRTGDLIAGATMSVSLNVFSDANSCEIPVDFAPQPAPFECLDANYIVQYDNGTLIEQGTIPSGGSVTVEVPNPISCQDANYTLTDSLGNVLDSGTIASGGSATITAPDATFTISNTLGDLIDTGSILSGGNENVIAPDGTNNINKSNGVLIQSVSIPSNATIATDIADSVITLNNTEATTLSTTNVLATDSATITAPDATVNVNKSDSTPIASVTAPSGGVEPYNVADSVITVNSDAYTDLLATDSLNIPIVDINGDAVATTVLGSNVQVDDLPCAGGVTRSTATLMRTGKTIIVRTGDDADTRSEGRETDRVTLDSAPIHNNGSATINTTTNRFTDYLGGQTYANDIVLDWSTWNGSTLLGYDKNFVVEDNWDDGIDSGLANSVGTFTSGWRLANLNEGMNIFDVASYIRLNYAPFNFSTNTIFMTGTTRGSDYFCIVNATLFSSNYVVKRGLTGDAYTIFVRTFYLSLSNILT